MFSLASCIIVLNVVGVFCDENVKTDKLPRDCDNSYSLTCLKLDIVSFVDRINEKESYSVFPGISLVRENTSSQVNTADMVTELAREFPNNAEARLDAFLLRKIGSFLNSHSMRLDWWTGTSSGSDVATGRKDKKGGGGGLGYLIAAGAMMKGTLLAIALGALAALAGKALMTALISLMLSAIVGLKSLTSHGGKQTTYEIVSKPIYSHTNSHSSEVEHGGHYGGYGRSLDLSLPLGLQKNYVAS